MIANGFTSIDEITKTRIQQHFNVDRVTIKRDVQIIKDWIKQQPHLPQNNQDDFIERCLLNNKFRIEQTKEKLEKYYSLKGLHADAFRRIRSPQPSKTTQLILPIYKLTDNLERIVIFKINDTNPSDDDILKFFKYVLCASEYSLRFDYNVGPRVIQDFDGISFNHVKKYAETLSPYSKAYYHAYFSRVSGVEYINIPPFMDILLRTLKALLSEKMFKKISVHKNLESLHRNVDKSFLPKEYGGDLGSFDELLAIWDKEFESKIDTLENCVVTEISNESLRIGAVKYNEIFGADGTFRNLDID